MDITLKLRQAIYNAYHKEHKSIALIARIFEIDNISRWDIVKIINDDNPNQ